MAYGIDSEIAARVAANRGNPQALQQKYAQNQQLIDLLALQKLKSEKEAAAREMQLKMAQQQAMKGPQGTIKDQREQEVMDMTKQELAQQVGGIAQQQQQEQQKKMQQLMQSGIASAPAPNMARMAGGGIVAFAGEDGSYVQGEESSYTSPDDIRAYKPLFPKLGEGNRRFKLKQLGYSNEQIDRMSPSEQEFIVQRAGEPSQQEAPKGIATVTPPTPTPPTPTPPTPPAAPSQGIASVTPPAVRPPAAPAAPTPAVPPTDPLAMQKERQKEVTGLLSLTPEQLRIMEQNAEKTRKLYEEEMDPEARRRRQLQEFLIGAGGRTSLAGALGAGARASEAERRRGFQESLKGTELINKKLEDIIGTQRGAVKEGIASGDKAGELGGRMYETDVRSRDAALEREIKQEANRLQAAYNKIQQEGLDSSRAQSLLSLTTDRISKLKQAAEANFSKEYAMLITLERSGGKLDPAQKQQLEVGRAALERKLLEIDKQFSPVVTGLTSRVGGNTMLNLSKEDQARVNQYLGK